MTHLVRSYEFYKSHGLWRVAIRYDDDLEEDRPATQFELHLRDEKSAKPEAEAILREIDASGVLYAHNLDLDAKVANFLNSRRENGDKG